MQKGIRKNEEWRQRKEESQLQIKRQEVEANRQKSLMEATMTMFLQVQSKEENHENLLLSCNWVYKVVRRNAHIKHMYVRLSFHRPEKGYRWWAL